MGSSSSKKPKAKREGRLAPTGSPETAPIPVTIPQVVESLVVGEIISALSEGRLLTINRTISALEKKYPVDENRHVDLDEGTESDSAESNLRLSEKQIARLRALGERGFQHLKNI